MAELFRFAAFISYSSKDAGFARRLHSALEAYGIPATLGQFDLLGGGGRKNRIYPVFRDREELPAGDLGAELEAALKASGALIVVCSPAAAASIWVEKEIAYYLGLARRERIFTIIATDAPLLTGGRDATPDCFPPALRGDPSGDHVLVAADARPGKDGFRNAWLKLVAGLIGVNAGVLADRDQRRRRVRRVAVGFTAGVATALALTVAVWLDTQAWRTRLTTTALDLACVFHEILGSDSTGRWAAISRHRGQGFHAIVGTLI